MKVGDRVKINKNFVQHNKQIRPFQKGKIIGFYNIGIMTLVGVEFDEYVDGHDCGGIGKGGHCSWMSAKNLVKL